MKILTYNQKSNRTSTGKKSEDNNKKTKNPKEHKTPFLISRNPEKNKNANP